MIAPELDDMFAPAAIAAPYGHYARLREADPVHWNERYQLWVITRHDDIVWMIRHHELFSSAVIRNDPRPPYPPGRPRRPGPGRLRPAVPRGPARRARPARAPWRSAQHPVPLAQGAAGDLELAGRPGMERRLRVWVGHGACVGNGTCLTIAPGVFVHNADRQSEAANPAGERAARILAAAENCPVGTIHVEDVASGETLCP